MAESIKTIAPECRYEIEHHGGMSIQGELIPIQTFTVKETVQLMKAYAHARVVAVQSSRGADRCGRQKKDRGMIHYIYLLKKADSRCREIESKMLEWTKV